MATGSLASSVLARISLLLLTAVAISANFLNYGPLIPLLQSELHISSGQAGLFSTFLYGGIACSYLPGGMLADRYGSRRVLMGALLLIGAGGCLLPLVASLPWMVGCRLLIGLGAGAAIVAGSQAAARLGDYAALGQGLYGGAMQLGAGLGLFGTPLLLLWSQISGLADRQQQRVPMQLRWREAAALDPGALLPSPRTAPFANCLKKNSSQKSQQHATTRCQECPHEADHGA